MPLIVRWPGVTKPGSVDDHLVQNLDYAETFLDLAGAVIPDDMQGRSLVPLLRGQPPADWRDSIYYHYYGFPAVHQVARHYGIRTDRHKLIRYPQVGKVQLFDVRDDPWEIRNLADDPAQAPLVERLTRRLKELQKMAGDRLDLDHPASPANL